MAELAVTVAEDNPAVRNLIDLLWRMETIYAEIYLVQQSKNFHKVIEVSEKLSQSESVVPEKDQLRFASAQKGNSIEIVVLGVKDLIPFIAVMLGVLISFQKYAKLKAETEKARAETAMVKLELFEKYDRMLSAATPSERIRLLRELFRELNGLGLHLDVSQIDRYLAQEKTVFGPLDNLHGSEADRKKIVDHILAHIEEGTLTQIIKIRF